MTRRHLQSRVLRSLRETTGQRHINHIYEEVRRRCAKFLGRQKLPVTDRELANARFFTFLTLWNDDTGEEEAGAIEDEQDDRADAELAVVLDPGSWDHNNPAQDIRVTWFTNELDSICSYTALVNLCRDIITKNQGRRSTIPVEREVSKNLPELRSVPSQKSAHDDEDTRRAWDGLLFAKGEDAAIKAVKTPSGGRAYRPYDPVQLIRVLRDNPEIADAFSSTGRWPIARIVDLLSACSPDQPWDAKRVDNAKENLVSWAMGLKRKYGIEDFVDIAALLARVARRLNEDELKRSAGTLENANGIHEKQS